MPYLGQVSSLWHHSFQVLNDQSHIAKEIYADKLKINLHYRRRAIQCITINVCSPSPHVSGLLAEGRAGADIADLGETARVGHVRGCLGRRSVLTVPRKSSMPQSNAPGRVSVVLGFRIKLYKTKGCKWPFPHLIPQ